MIANRSLISFARNTTSFACSTIFPPAYEYEPVDMIGSIVS